MNLDDLLNEMSEKMRNRDLSDEYLREHNNSTREEIGIGEYAYGITMIPCKWVYEYLSDYKRVLKENELLRKDIEGWEKYCEEIREEQTEMSNKNYELEFKVEKLQKENEMLKRCHIQDNKNLDFVMANCILKEKVKGKIEALSKTKSDLATYIAVSERIRALQELLESEDSKDGEN